MSYGRFQTQDELIDYTRDRYPGLYRDMSDEDIYSSIQELGQQKGFELPVYKPVTPILPAKSTDDISKYENEDTSPEAWGNIFELGSKIGLSNAGELFTETGVTIPGTGFTISADFFKKAYNTHNVGNLYKYLYGKQKYEYDTADYEEKTGAAVGDYAYEAGSFLVGALAPLEASIFLASGGLGAIGSKVALGASNFFKRFALKSIGVNASRGLGPFATNLISGATSSGIGLGSFGAAHAGFSSAATQRMIETKIDKNPESPTYGEEIGVGMVNPTKVMEDMADGFSESFLIGAPAGLLGKGLLGSYYAINKLSEKPLMSLSRMIAGAPGQLTTEIAAFTALPNLYKEVGLESYKDYPALMSPEWRGQGLMNTLIITPMFGISRGIERIKRNKDVFKLHDEAIKMEQEDAVKVSESASNLEANVREFGVTSDMIPGLAAKKTDPILNEKDIAKHNENVKKLYEIIDRTDGDIKKATKKDNDFMQFDGMKVYQDSHGVLLDLQSNPAKLRVAAERMSKKTLSDAEFEAIKQKLDAYIQDVQDMFINMEYQATGINRDVAPTGEVVPTPVAPSGSVRMRFWTGSEWITSPKAFQINSKEYLDNVSKGWEVISETVTPSTAPPTPVTPGLSAEESAMLRGVAKKLGYVDYATAEQSVMSKKTLERIDKNIPSVNQSDLNTSHKNLLAYTLDNLPGNRSASTVSKEGLDLLKYVEKTYGKDRSIHQLGKQEIDRLGINYIHDKTGISWFDLTSSQKGDFTPREAHVIRSKIDTIRDRLYTVLSDKTGNLNSFLAGDMLASFKKPGAKGARKIEVEGGKPGLNKWLQFAESKDNHNIFVKGATKAKDRTISINKEEASLATELAIVSAARPEEIPAVRLGDLDLGRGVILFKRSKAKPTDTQTITEIQNADLANRLADFAARTGKTGQDKIFSFKNAKEFNAFAKYLSKGSHTPVRIHDRILNEFFAPEDIIPGITIGKITIKDKKAGSGLQYGRAFRRAYGEHGLPTDIQGMTRTMADIGAERGISPKAAESYAQDIIPEKLQREPIGIPESSKVLKEFLREQAIRNPGLKINTLQDAEFAGRFQTGVIDVVLGKANKATWYHENAHRLEDMIKRTGNKELLEIWKRGEKLFKKESKEAGQPMSEFMADELSAWSIGRSKNKSIASKMSSWASMLWSKIKKVFFGKSSLNKNDIRRLLGQKVFKGFAESKTLAGKSMEMYQYPSIKDRADAVQRNFESAIDATGKKLSRVDKDILINYIANRARVAEPEKFRLGDAKMLEADIIAFNTELNSMPFKKLVALSDKGRTLNTISSIESIERDAVTPNSRKKLLDFFGIDDIYNATDKQLKRYQAYLMKIKYPGEKDNTAWLLEQRAQQLASMPKNFKAISGLKRKAALFAFPTHEVVAMLGLKDLSNKLLRHSSVEARLLGDFTAGFEAKAERILGSSWEGRIGKGQRENLFLLDAERYIDRLNNNELTVSNKKFMQKAFKKDYVITKNGKYKINPKYKQIRNAINLNTKEGKIVELWGSYTKEIEYKLSEATKPLFKTQAEHAEFLESNPVNWIRKNIYISRVPTKEAMKILSPQGGAHYMKLLQATSTRIAKELAFEKYGAGVTAEQIKLMESDAIRIAESVIQDQFTFGKGKISSRFIKPRHDKLPEFINVDGKKIKVYETGYEETIKRYAMGMSKFIANVEVFPSMVEYTHRNVSGNASKLKTSQLLKRISGNKEWGSWVEKQVERQLGVTETVDGLLGDASSMMDKGATIFAKTALSFPVSGGKNFIYGQAMSMQTWYLRDYFRGMTKIFSKDFRHSVGLTGGLELGLRHITSLKTQKMWDVLFKAGGMKPSENINRYIDVAAGKYDQARLIRTISNKNQSAKKIEKAIHRLKNFYHLNDRQVGLLKKYGEHGISGHEKEFKNSFEKGKVNKELMNIEQQLNHFAHVNTQGASMALFQPSWASGKVARPLTLFKRMAYAASDNKVRNFKLAVKNKDMLKIGMMALTPIASGVAISSMYHHILGSPVPKENSSWYEWIKSMLIRGEFLGVATDGLRWLEGESAKFTIYPALHNWGLAMYDAILAPIQGKKTVLQSTDDLARQTFGAYRGYMSIKEKTLNPEKKRQLRFKSLWKNFMEEMFPNDPHGYEHKGLADLTPLSKFYDDFRTVFYGGTQEEACKQYVVALFSVASGIRSLGTDIKGRPIHTDDEALDDAVIRLGREMTKMNPNPISFYDDLPDLKKKYAPRWNEWLQKDPDKYKEYLKDMDKSEIWFQTRKWALLNLSENYINDPVVLRKVKKSLRKLALAK